jgi:hypothetical protein
MDYETINGQLEVCKPEDFVEKIYSSEKVILHPRIINDILDGEFSLTEYKLVDVYIALINQKDIKSRLVKISKRDLEKALCVKKINRQNLEKMLDRLAEKIKFRDENKYLVTHLFSDAGYSLNENHTGYIYMNANERMYPYFFNPCSFQKYPVGVVCKLRTINGLRMFWYLADNKFRGCWQISVTDLRNKLQISAYPEFKHFKQKVLEKLKVELEKAEILFEYKVILGKDNNTAVAIEFSNVIFPKSKTLEQIIRAGEIEDDSRISEIMNILRVSSKSAGKILDKAMEYDLSDEDLHERLTYVSQYPSEIKNIVAFTIKILSPDWEAPKKKIVKFPDFSQSDMSEEMREMENLFITEVNS